MDIKPFSVGDAVGVMDYSPFHLSKIHAPIGVLTVTRVMKRFLETSDGRRWSLSGYATGHTGYRPTRAIVHLDEDVKEAMKKRGRWDKAEKVWDALSKIVNNLSSSDIGCLVDSLESALDKAQIPKEHP